MFQFLCVCVRYIRTYCIYMHTITEKKVISTSSQVNLLNKIMPYNITFSTSVGAWDGEDFWWSTTSDFKFPNCCIKHTLGADILILYVLNDSLEVIYGFSIGAIGWPIPNEDYNTIVKPIIHSFHRAYWSSLLLRKDTNYAPDLVPKVVNQKIQVGELVTFFVLVR